MELTTKDWKDFEIGDLFDQIGSTAVKKPFDKRNMPEDEFIIPALSSKIDNNSFGFYVREEDHLLINRLCLSITLNGDAGKVYVQNKAFAIAQDAYAIYLKDDFNILNNEAIYLFLATIMEKVLMPKYGYTNKATWNKVKKETLLLPSKNDEPDWDFMEEFIKEIEEKYILNVDKYNQENIDKALSITGLTTADLNGNLEVKSADRYEVFRVGDLFETDGKRVLTGSYVPKDILNLHPGKIPRITVKSVDNGVDGHYSEIINDPNYRIYENFISVTFLGDCFYQKYKASLDMKVHCLKPLNIELNDGTALFLITAIKKELQIYSYGSQLSSEDLKNVVVKLPAIDENIPDFDYMEKAIYIYIKKVIKSWKMDNEKEIRALKSVINK